MKAYIAAILHRLNEHTLLKNIVTFGFSPTIGSMLELQLPKRFENRASFNNLTTIKILRALNLRKQGSELPHFKTAFKIGLMSLHT